MNRIKDNARLKAAVFCLGNATFITRYHRNVTVLKELGFQVRSFSVKPREWTQVEPFEGVLVDGWTRRFRGRLFTPLKCFEVGFRCFLAILQYKPDILFAHNLPGLVIGWMIACLRGRNKTVLIYDAMELECARTPRIRLFIPFLSSDCGRLHLERFLAKRPDIIVAADYARAEVMSQALSRSDILTCRNIPKLAEIPRMNLFHDLLGLKSDAFIFLYQGYVDKGRGLEQAIRSLKDLPESIVFVVMGIWTQSYGNALKKLSESIGVAERVFILPPVPSDELLKWTASADVIHSLTENTCLSYYLGAPNKLYEAAAVGVPVIASHFPEIEAVLTRYPYGILVNPVSVQEIADALLFLYENKAVRREFSEVALRASRTELNWEMESQKLKHRICEVIERIN